MQKTEFLKRNYLKAQKYQTVKNSGHSFAVDRLQNAFDLSVQGDVGHGFGIDGKGHAIEIVEMEKAANVVILVITGKKLLGLGAA